VKRLPTLVLAAACSAAVSSSSGLTSQEPSAQQAVRHDPVVGCIVAGHFPVLDSCVDPAGKPTIAQCKAYFRGQGAPTWFSVVSKPHPTRADCYQSILLKPKKKTLTAMEFYFECLSKNAADNRTEDFTARVVDSKTECDKEKLVAAPFSNTGPVGVLGSGGGGFVGGAGSILPIAGAVGGLGAIGGALIATNNDSGGDGTSNVTTTTIPTTTTTTTTTTTSTTTTTTTTTVPLGPNRPPEITCNVRGATEGPPPLTIVMRLCGSRDPDGDDLRFEYDFGDGTIGGGSCESDAHTYSGEGSWTATACVSDRQPGPDHKKCCTFPVTAAFPPPTPTCDTIPPTVAVTDASEDGSCNITINATASDNGSVASVAFYRTQTYPTSGPTTLIGTDTSAPYSVVWSPGYLFSTQNFTAVAIDNCGNQKTSAPLSFTTGSCGEIAGAEAQAFHWTAQLEASGSAGRVSLNGALLANGPGKQEGSAQASRQENRVDAELVQGGSRPGLWRFDFSAGVAPGSVRVLAGDAVEVSDNAVVFRIAGTTGERVGFVFRPRD
jgi:hypothetical protein